MPSPSRRDVLAALCGLASLGGCASVPSTNDRSTTEPVAPSTTASPAANTTRTTDRPSTSSETTTEVQPTTRQDTSTTTERPEPVPPAAEDLDFRVRVVRRPSAERPGRVRATLANRTGSALELSGGDPIPVGYRTIDTEPVDADTPLMLLPKESDRVNDYFLAESGTRMTVDQAVFDECWKAPDAVASTASGNRIVLEPDSSIASDFFPLGHANEGCPAGRYASYGDMVAQSTDRDPLVLGSVTTSLLVEVASDGRLAVEGSMRVEALKESTMES